MTDERRSNRDRQHQHDRRHGRPALAMHQEMAEITATGFIEMTMAID